MTISTDLSITTLHVNGLSVPIKRHMVAEKKKNITLDIMYRMGWVEIGGKDKLGCGRVGER